MDLTKLRAITDDLFQVCPHCGLSSKAQIRCPDHHGERFCWAPVASHSHSELCSCQASAKSDWLKFVIGDPTAYRSDPAQALDDLKNIWIEKGLKQKYQIGHGDAVQKPQAGWEGPGHRRAQVDRTQLQHTDSVAEFTARPFDNTHPNGRSQQEVAESHMIDLTVQNASMPCQPIRGPERLYLVQHDSLKRSGAVRGKYTPHSGSIRSFCTDLTATPRTGSYAESSSSARRHIRPRADTRATASEYQRLNERSYFDPSESLLLHAQPASPFAYNEDDLSTPISTDSISSTTIMGAPQPSRRVSSHGPLHRHTSITGDTDTDHQPFKHSRSILSSHGIISDDPDLADDEPTPRKPAFPAQTRLSKVPSEEEWLDARQSVIEEDGDHAVDGCALDRVKDFLSGTPLSAFFHSDPMDNLTLTDSKDK
ncbi:hypothetical protein N0V86_004659 [Didymella sp. IMI 355093]|nr:hypothetical protein N0V86_004659 [Didymella sp. IMI 355093]